MAGELHHVDPGPVITRNEYIAPTGLGGHTVNGGANGDLLQYNGTSIVRLAIGTAGQVLTVSGGVPTWGSVGAGAFPLLAPNGTVGAPSYAWSAEPSMGFLRNSAQVMDLASGGVVTHRFQSNGFIVGSASEIAWTSGNADGTRDVRLFRDAANVLAQRNSTTAQAFRIYNTYTDASNYERGEVRWSTGDFHIGTFNAGTGTAKRLLFLTGGAGRWYVHGANGHFLAETDNLYDIGASGATRPRTLYTSTNVITPTVVYGVTGGASDVQLSRTALRTLTFDSGPTTGTGATFNVGPSGTSYTLNVFGNVAAATIVTTGNGSQGAPSFAFASDPNSGWFWQTSGAWDYSEDNNHVLRLGRDGANAAHLNVGNGAVVWGTGPTVADLYIRRDAANTLAQRNGTTAQIYRLYNTYTDGSNYERANFLWTGNVFYIQTEAAGTGTARNIAFQTAGITNWIINTSGHFIANTDNTFDIGASGATRPRSIYVGTQFFIPQGPGSLGYGIAGDANTGFGSDTADNLILTAGGTVRFRVRGTGAELGTSAVRSVTEPTNSINIYNGTAPSGTLANGATFYAQAGEMWVMDAGGTGTQLSPHDQDGFWWFNSRTRQGKKLEIDVEKILRFVNDKYGLDMVRELELAGT